MELHALTLVARSYALLVKTMHVADSIQLLHQFVLLCFILQSEKDSKEEILKAFRLFDDDETVSCSVVTKQVNQCYSMDASLRETHSYQLDVCSVHTQRLQSRSQTTMR